MQTAVRCDRRTSVVRCRSGGPAAPPLLRSCVNLVFRRAGRVCAAVQLGALGKELTRRTGARVDADLTSYLDALHREGSRHDAPLEDRLLPFRALLEEDPGFAVHLQEVGDGVLTAVRLRR